MKTPKEKRAKLTLKRPPPLLDIESERGLFARLWICITNPFLYVFAGRIRFE